MGVYYTFVKSHYSSVKIQAEKRINIIKGQLDGLLKMVSEDQYCVDILNQSLAIQNSLKSLDVILFERHLTTHVPHQFSHDQKKAVGELVTLFKRISK